MVAPFATLLWRLCTRRLLFMNATQTVYNWTLLIDSTCRGSRQGLSPPLAASGTWYYSDYLRPMSQGNSDVLGKQKFNWITAVLTLVTYCMTILHFKDCNEHQRVGIPGIVLQSLDTGAKIRHITACALACRRNLNDDESTYSNVWSVC